MMERSTGDEPKPLKKIRFQYIDPLLIGGIKELLFIFLRLKVVSFFAIDILIISVLKNLLLIFIFYSF